MDKGTIQAYINNFRRRIARFLKPGVGITCNVYPAASGGAILEFTLGQGTENDDLYKEVSPSLGAALGGIEQRAFGGNLSGFNFVGTNTILENNRIILIKDDSLSEWNEETAEKDVIRLVSRSERDRP